MSEGLSIAVGLLMHYAIAFVFTTLFFWITHKLPSLLRQRLLLGALYGVVIWVVMNPLLVPLTRAAQPPFIWNGVLIGMGILNAAIGLPLALWLRPAPVPRR